MVPSASASLKIPTMSYADRAKKAQNIRSPNGTQYVAPAHHTAVPSTASASQPIVMPLSTPSTSKSSFTSTSVENASSFPGPPSSGSKLSSPPDAPRRKDPKEEPYSNQDTTVVSSSHPTSLPSPQKPTPQINVWKVRKEQMAQAQMQLRPPQPPSSTALKPAQRQPVANASSPVSRRAPESTPVQTDFSHPPHIPQNNKQSAGPVNGTAVVTTEDEDPFVVRVPPRLQRKPSPPGPISLPPMDDRESWPEVGKSVPSTAAHSHVNTPGVEKVLDFKTESDSSKDADRVPNQNAVPRKGEKTKWIQIPPEELQATADSMRSSNRHVRNHSQAAQHSHSGSNTRKHQASSSGSGSGSGQISRGQSRSHSGRNSISHSATQSRGQSRVGSLQSSPRLQAQSRRLPDDEVARQIAYGVDISNQAHKSSGSSTPYINVGHGSYPAYIMPPTIRGTVENGATYYPTPLPPSIQAIPQPPYTYTSSSPMHTLYSLPIPGYTGHSPGSHSPSDIGRSGYTGAGTPPYTMYSQYGPYGYGQPYIPWNDHSHALAHEHQMHFTHHQPPPEVPRYDKPEVPPRPPVLSPSSKEASQHTPWQGDSSPGQPLVEGAQKQEDSSSDRQRSAKEVVFGSIGLPDVDESDSAAPALEEKEALVGKDAPQAVKANENVCGFSIGVAPGESVPYRSKPPKRSAKNRAGSEITGRPGVNTTNGNIQDPSNHIQESENSNEHATELKDEEEPDSSLAIETKWRFGTIGSSGNDEEASAPLGQPELDDNLVPNEALPADETRSQNPYHGDIANMPVEFEAVGGDPPAENGLSTQTADLSLADLSGSSLRGAEDNVNAADEWQVRDFGYGFGNASNSGNGSGLNQQEKAARDWERGRGRDNNMRDRDWDRDRTFGRPRRGSFAGSGYDRGRRGRGFGGRGFNGRGFGRGGYPPHQHQRLNSFPLVSPPQFSGIPVSTDHLGPYLHGGHQVTYLPAYDSYPPHIPAVPQSGPPVPLPLSALPFPLDPTRSYLLGQLEYYLSPQNLAQDFYLRQRMDSRGWISIALIASFKRVTQLTTDLHLVKDVLSLSNFAEVKDDWVRMIHWEPFVLPTAPISVVEPPLGQATQDLAHSEEPLEAEAEAQATDCEAEECDGDGEGYEDEEEEVEFVIGEEAAGSWTPERQPLSS